MWSETFFFVRKSASVLVLLGQAQESVETEVDLVARFVVA